MRHFTHCKLETHVSSEGNKNATAEVNLIMVSVNVICYFPHPQSKHHTARIHQHHLASPPEANGPSQMRAHPCEIKHQMRSASHCLNVLLRPLALAHTQIHTSRHGITHQHTHTGKQGLDGEEWMVHFEIHQEGESPRGSFYLTSILKSLKRQTL